ncbi:MULTISPECIES: glycine cleavage system protein GcvH [Olivibacter]|uniref:Glycine cleavage system H protein n=1 Tax=Olivibacter jilunii TaxID=985016 RepID=A0ABW6B6S7_9SPHI
MKNPENNLYSKEHTWLKIEGETALVGITFFAQSELGEIVYVDLPKPGTSFKQDEEFGSVEALKTTSDLFMPISGEIIETNEELNKNPEWINTDPFGQGWMVKIKISQPSEAENLLSADSYREMVGM